MPYRTNLSKPGYYHVFNRGNNKKSIFKQDVDYLHFLRQLKRYKDRYSIGIVCYCLMSNHFHLCVRVDDRQKFINFIKQVQMVHAQHMQRQHGMIGHLFQGRYKCKYVKFENQLIYLSAYIHSNPAVAGLVKNLDRWQWSSYLDYAGIRKGSVPNKEVVLYYFKSSGHYKDWINNITADKIKSRLTGLI